MKGFVIKDERETLSAVIAGKSVARLGDGEIKLIQGHSAKSQERNSRLAGLMRSLMHCPGAVLCGIPTFDKRSPKYSSFWHAYERRFRPLMNPSVTYFSAFVTRPDSAPWIDTPDYWDAVRSIWRDKDVMLIRGSGKSLTPDRLPEAKSVQEVLCPVRHAFSEYDNLCRIVRSEHGGRTVILCAGATATAMAYELGNENIHMVDLGHIGLWLGRREGQVAAEYNTEGK